MSRTVRLLRQAGPVPALLVERQDDPDDVPGIEVHASDEPLRLPAEPGNDKAALDAATEWLAGHGVTLDGKWQPTPEGYRAKLTGTLKPGKGGKR